ncbi:MAG TPA: DUF4175 family protein [Bacteroidota bacterium]|nr:DUF4175 family protein [Bacteroidota bacterium]
MNDTKNILSDLLKRIDAVRRNNISAEILSNTFSVAASIVAGWLLVTAAEAIFNFSHSVRTILFFISLFGILTGIGWWIIRPWLRLNGVLKSENDEQISRQIGKYFPAINDRLLNALQLAEMQNNADAWYSSELLDASLKKFSGEIESIDFTASVNRSAIPKRRNIFCVSAFFTILCIGIFPHSLGDAAYRLMHFTQRFEPPAKYRFEIFPGNKEIVKNDNVEISINVTSSLPTFASSDKSLTLSRKQQGQENIDEGTLKPDSNGTYRATISSLHTTTEYFARYDGEESDHFTLTVLDRPIIRSFHIRLEYPAYAKLPAKTQDDFAGDITALAGTRIIISGFASKPLQHAVLMMSDSTQHLLTVNGERFSTSFTINKDNAYYFALNDAEGLSNIDPVRYQIKIIPDEFPTIAITEPGHNIDIAGTQSLPLHLLAKDDFGISSIRLGYRLIQSKYEQPQQNYTFVQIPISASSNAIDMFYTWELSSLHLVPEDVVEYVAEAFDNDNIHGPKAGRSNTYLLRLPSLEEVFADADKEHEQSIDDMKESLNEAKKLKQEMESLNRDLKNNKDPNWQTKKKLEEMVKKYEAVQKKLDETQSRLEQMTQQLQQQNVLSKETMEKYSELQQLMQQMNSEELQRMLQQAQQSPNLTKEQLQQAMKQMAFSEEQFRESIERTLELLKRMHIEQKVDEVKKRAQELEREQRQLKEESANAKNDAQKQQELAKRQIDLAKKEQAMEREAADLQKRMEEFFTEMPADKMQKLSQQLQQQQLDMKMQQAAQQMQSNNMQQSQQTQQQVQQQLQQFSQQMDAMQQQMLQQQTQYVLNQLRKATNNLLELSKEEEALKQQSQNAPPNSSQLKQNAQDQQQTMHTLQNLTNDLSELSKKSFVVTPTMGNAIGEALARMNNAMQQLIDRNGSQASQEQTQAMASLNNAAMQIQNAMNAMQQGGHGGAGSLMQQLRQMAGQQMSINMQTQQMGGKSQQEMEQAARLAQQQAAVQKSIEQLNKEAQQSSDGQRLLGDLQRLADEMKEVVRDLEQNNISDETKRKQDRILSRMLDASTSMRERDYEKKRKSETGTDYTRQSPQELDPATFEGKNRLHDDLLKAMEQGYSKDYQELIKKYFEQLENSQKVLN